MDIHVAKQCCPASFSAPINTIWKGLAVKVVQERSLNVIHGPNCFKFQLNIYGCKEWYLSC